MTTRRPSTMAALLRHYLSINIVSHGTTEQYAIAARQWDTLICIPPAKISLEAIAKYLRALEAQGLSAGTRKSRLGVIKSLCGYGAEHGWTPANIRWPRSKSPRRERQAFSVDQLHSLLRACREWDAPKNGRKASRGWTAAHMFALAVTIYETGERIEALTLVPRSHHDAERRTLYAPAELRKGKGEDKLHSLTDAASDLLSALPVSERLFEWQGKVQTLRHHWKRILRNAGLPTGRRYLFHCLRRTHATHVTAVAGIEAASRSLGHSSSAVTMRYYVMSSLLPQQRVCDLLPTWQTI